MKNALPAVIVAVVSVACGSGAGDLQLDRPADTFGPTSYDPIGERAVGLVEAKGGKVMTPGGSGVTIEPGALSSGVQIQVEAEKNAPSPDEGTAVGRTYLFGPEGQTFDVAATVTVEIDPAQLYPGETASDVVLYTSPRDNPSFTPLPTTKVDATHVSAKTTHFSYFVPMHGTTVASLAYGNVGKGACSRNSKGGHGFATSCDGNGGEPEYWCADFARWVWGEAGADVGGLTAGAGSFYVYGQDHHTLHDSPAVGDAVVFNYQGGGYADHVAIVVKVEGGSIETVSGDWGGDSGSESFFSSTSHVVLNAPAYGAEVGTYPGIIGMKISGFIAPAGMGPSIPEGEYLSTAKELGDSAEIQDWKAGEGFVLGYFSPGAKMYAKTVTDHSVYGLIEKAGYGGWDYGHHCGWIELGKGVHVEGSGSHNKLGDSCPSPDNDFSLDHRKAPTDKEMFRKGSYVDDVDEVEAAVVLPTCSDFTVYANYDPVTHTLSNPDGREEAHRGTRKNLDAKNHCDAPKRGQSWTPYVSESGVEAKSGYCGFGTRYVSADGYAVQIKDTERPGKSITAWGFMRADCIAGSQVGDPAGHWPPHKPDCGVLEAGKSLHALDEVRSCNHKYWLNVSAQGEVAETELHVGSVWTVDGKTGDRLDMQSDGNLVLYSGKKALWATGTYGNPGAFLSLQDDGNLVVYFGSTVLWKR